MRKKRVLALFLVVCMLATSISVAWASDTDTSSDDTSAVATEEETEASDEDADTVEAAEEDAEEEDADVSEDSDTEEEEEEVEATETPDYYTVLQEYDDLRYSSVSEDTQIVLSYEDAVGNTDLTYVTEDDQTGIDFSEDADCEYVEWTFTVEETGIYIIDVDFYNISSYGMTIQRKVEIDGDVPFDEANTIYLHRYYEETPEVTTNAIGDEVAPKSTEISCWQTESLLDYSGYFDDPLQFYLEEGEHTLRISMVDQDILLGDVTLRGMTQYETYEEVEEEYIIEGYEAADSEGVTFEAEDTAWRNDSTLKRGSDSDPATSPSSATTSLLNVMGESRWSTGNQSITWEFEVDAEGLYTINMRALNNFNTGMPSTRQILIDGEIPFEELKSYNFEYNSSWAAYTLHDSNGSPYEFYLEEGKHTITMVVKSGTLYDVIQMTNEIITEINEIYLKITKVTTTSPDSNYEYELAKTFPELEGNSGEFATVAKELEECADVIADLTSTTTDLESDFLEIADTLWDYAEDPDAVTSDIGTLEDAQTNLGEYITTMEESALTIDYFSILPADDDTEFTIETSTWWQNFYYTAMNFIASFTKDYDAVGSIMSEGSSGVVIDVWIARGTEWGEVLKDLIDEDFTATTGIGVNINILPSGQLDSGNVSALMLSIVSGTDPDVALSVSYSDPVEFAFRDAVLDLTQFDDFEEFQEEFNDTMFVPYEYEKDGHTGIYGVPETMDFMCTIYRTDILESLELEVPDTWDELYYNMLPILYDNSMSFSFPVDTSASSNSPSSLKGMTMFLVQQGGSYYTDDGMYSALDSPEAYNAFKQWTDLYVSYGLDAESSFFQRFRTGTLPIGIGSYTAYIQILTQAPELYGRWAIAPMIGTTMTDEDGNEYVDRRTGGISLTACQIMSSTEYPEESWEFLKWWMGYETQISFGQEVEAAMGITARWNSANKVAFESLPWDQSDLAIIEEQMALAEEQPIVLGGYFTTRYLVSAWNSVYISGKNARDVLEDAVTSINAEIRKKHEEYGFTYDD